ncbi:MAG TPA: hypothetical protein VF445_02435 [Bordetella sp.]|uniref:hypothetical protein n=1 Tax=Bordetella sp. TaxID=28081 RepID=UPI002ED57A0B
MDDTAQKLKREAKRQGADLHINFAVMEQDGSERWLGELVDLLLAHPELAELSNRQLLAKIAERLALARPLAVNRMSKLLSAPRRDMAERRLREAQYSASDIKTGSDIKSSIKAGKVATADIKAMITTGFQPDGIVLDGFLHKYRKRDITPTGQPWHDFNVRFCKSDIPLGAVLKMRGVSIGEFQAADEQAQAAATPEQRHAREALTRRGVQPRELGRMLNFTTSPSAILVEERATRHFRALVHTLRDEVMDDSAYYAEVRKAEQAINAEQGAQGGQLELWELDWRGDIPSCLSEVDAADGSQLT